MLTTHATAARTRRLATTTPAMRPDDTLDLEGVAESVGENEAGGDVAALAGRVEIVVANDDGEVEEVDVGDVDGGEVDVADVEVEEAVVDEAAEGEAGCGVLSVGCGPSSRIVVSSGAPSDFMSHLLCRSYCS